MILSFDFLCSICAKSWIHNKEYFLKVCKYPFFIGALKYSLLYTQILTKILKRKWNERIHDYKKNSRRKWDEMREKYGNIHIIISKTDSQWKIAIWCRELIEKAMALHSSSLAWNIPWIEEPGGLQSMGSQRVGQDWATSLSLFTFMYWRRKWQPTPVFLPGESQGRGSLVGRRLWGSTESDTTETT